MTARAPVFALAVVGTLALGYVALRSATPGEDPSVRATLSVVDLLRGDMGEGFARALEPRPFLFPEDHGPHPDFRTEWWYLTGNLLDPAGRPFGFQLTLFRSALNPGAEAPGREDGASSSWFARQVYMGHFAVTDGEGGELRAFERFARGAQGLAGARARPFRVWVEDWSLEGPASPDSALFPLTLRAREGEVELTLALSPAKPMVLQGEAGLSRKGPEPGNASYYYSFTRLAASGEVRVGGVPLPVAGTAWMDREWSTSALSPGQVGWDWFALQLEDGYDLMFYRLRREDGSPDPLSSGSWVTPEGEGRTLAAEEVGLEVLGRWRSPLDGASYPARWRLTVPGERMEVEIVPLVPDQELPLTFRYWEGAVRVSGTRRGKGVEGVGYVELTGYADSGAPPASGRRISRTGGG